MTIRTLIFAALISALSAAPAIANSLMVEGLLRDNSGKVLEGQFEILFSLYDAVDAEEPVWSENHEEESVKAGFFQARLGADKTLDANLFAQNQNLWVGITLKGQPELPRTPLETDPFAFHALRASTAAVASGLDCSGCVDASMVDFSFAAAAAPGSLAEEAAAGSPAASVRSQRTAVLFR